MRPRLEERRVDLVARFDVFFGQDGPAGSDPADQRQADLVAQGVLELDAADQQVVADSIGTAEIARLLRRGAADHGEAREHEHMALQMDQRAARRRTRRGDHPVGGHEGDEGDRGERQQP